MESLDTNPLPPSNVDAEQAVLGAILMDNDVLYSMPPALTADSFYEPLHQRLFAAIRDTVDRGGRAEPIGLKARFDADPSLADIGGGRYTGKLILHAATPSDAAALAESICDLATRRRIIEACQKAIGQAHDLSMDATAGDIASSLSGKLDNDAAEAGRYRIRTEREVTAELYDRMKSRRFTPRLPPACRNWTPQWTAVSIAGKLYGLVGRKKHGKTMLASSISTNLKSAGTRHLFLALEMGSTEIHQRTLAGEIGCYESAFRRASAKRTGSWKAGRRTRGRRRITGCTSTLLASRSPICATSSPP